MRTWIGLLSLCALMAEVPPKAFGVWDRGDFFDPKDYPFLKGLSFNAPWSEVEPKDGVFDWKALDKAVDKAHRNDQFLYISLGVGPEAPEWIYGVGVPKVFTDDKRHEDKWPFYPYYLAPAYQTRFHRLITELGRHLRSYPTAKQARVAFIQVKTGCTGDEMAYKGEPKDRRYQLTKTSPEWLKFRLETFAHFVKTFQEGPGKPIDLLFNSVGGDADGEERYGEEWRWLTTHVKGGFGIKNGALSRAAII